MKKAAAGLIVIALLATAPATAAPAAPAGATPSVTSGFLSIKGPERLKARGKLRVPIRCSVECGTRVNLRLALPGPNVTDQLSGNLSPTDPRDLVITLNNPATQALKDHFRVARLKVRVNATDLATGATATARKVFRFKHP